MGGAAGDSQQDKIDLLSWAILDAIARDRHNPPDPAGTLGALGYGASADIRRILAAAAGETSNPGAFPRPAILTTTAYTIRFSGDVDALIAGFAAERADQVAAAIVRGG